MAEELSETDQIERDLARTRARMDNRLDELQEKMSPSQLVNDAFSYFRGGDGADFTNNLIQRAKANPLPVALTGIGLAWLMVSSHKASAATPSYRYEDDVEARIRHAEGQVHRYDDEHEDAYHSRLDDARGKVLGIARQASDTSASYGQRIKDGLSSAMQSVREKSHDAQAGASAAFSSLSDRAGQGRAAFQEGAQNMNRSVRDAVSSVTANPLALGAVAAVVGLVAGSLIPTSDEEEHLLGSTAGKLRNAGRDLAQNVIDRGGAIATDALAAVKGSADAHGLTGDTSVGDVIQGLKSGDLPNQVREVARETLQAGKDSAQTHLGGSGKTSAE